MDVLQTELMDFRHADDAAPLAVTEGGMRPLVISRDVLRRSRIGSMVERSAEMEDDAGKLQGDGGFYWNVLVDRHDGGVRNRS